MKQRRLLLISSSGGHWAQMKRVEAAFADCEKYYACTEASYAQHVSAGHFFAVPEASRWNKFKLVAQALVVLKLLLKIKPDVVITTGASPGFFAVVFARCLRRKAVWLDSIANVESLSMSGRMAGRFAHLWLTQWPHLARPGGPYYRGSVL